MDAALPWHKTELLLQRAPSSAGSLWEGLSLPTRSYSRHPEQFPLLTVSRSLLLLGKGLEVFGQEVALTKFFTLGTSGNIAGHMPAGATLLLPGTPPRGKSAVLNIVEEPDVT